MSISEPGERLRRATRPRRGAAPARPGRPRWRSGRRRRGRLRALRRARCRPRPGSRCRRAGPRPRAARRRARRPGAAASGRPGRAGGSASRRARAGAGPPRRARRAGRCRRAARRRTRGRRATIASAASFRFSTSFSGSCRRKTSMPLSAAQATNRRAKSPCTGREPTRKRPRTASASGVFVRAFSARMRSHGLSTPRRTAASKTPPPETSRYANPAPSRISATSKQVGGRHESGERLLREHADRGIDEARHGVGPYLPLPAGPGAPELSGNRLSPIRGDRRPIRGTADSGEKPMIQG